MLVKSTGQKSKGAGGRLLSYITRKSAIMRDSKGQPVIIKHNMHGKTIADFKRAFEENERNRRNTRKDQNYFFHEFVAFHRNDTVHLNAEILEDLTRRYLELRAPAGMGVAVFHEDKHLHAHILLSALELETGKALRLSKEEFEKVKEDLQRYQLERYPELTASVVEFDKEAEQFLTDEERQMKARTGGLSRKEELRDMLQNAFDKSYSPEDFYTRLSEQGLSLYERSGSVGIEDNRNYRLETLGYGEAKLQELNTRGDRMNELERIRSNQEMGIERGNDTESEEPSGREITPEKPDEKEGLGQ